MKNIFIKKTSYDGVASLPPIIKLTQYSSKLAVSYVENISNIKGYDRVGNIGNGYFDFSLDFFHPSEEINNLVADESNGIKLPQNINFINKLITNTKFPILRKTEDIDNRFYVIEIPDYGCQSMSPFYRDFVPQVYVNGYKVWQLYIGMIRQYSTKKAFICIDKNSNVAQLSGTNDEIIIRICFKNNIENIFDDQNSLTLTSSYAEKKLVLTADTNFIFISKNNIKDFQLFNNNTLVPNDLYFYKIEEVLNSSSSDVARQTTDSEDGESSSDYFKQAFINDYQSKTKEAYYRPEAIVRITITLNSEANIEGTWTLKSKQNNLMAYYTDKILDAIPIFSITNFEDINIFNSNGEKLSVLPIGTGTEYEVVPEYVNIRKYEFLINSVPNTTAISQTQILYDNFIYPYNRENAESLVYNSTGKLVYYSFDSETARIYSVGEDIIIYDNGDTIESPSINSESGITYSYLPNLNENFIIRTNNIITDPYLMTNRDLTEELVTSNIYPYNKDLIGLRLDEAEPYYHYSDAENFGTFLNKNVDSSFKDFQTRFNKFSEVVETNISANLVDSNYLQLEKNLYDTLSGALCFFDLSNPISLSTYNNSNCIVFKVDPSEVDHEMIIFYNDNNSIGLCQKIPLIENNTIGFIFLKDTELAYNYVFIRNAKKYSII